MPDAPQIHLFVLSARARFDVSVAEMQAIAASMRRSASMMCARCVSRVRIWDALASDPYATPMEVPA